MSQENQIILQTGQCPVKCIRFYSSDESVSLLAAGYSDLIEIWTCRVRDVSNMEEVSKLTDVLAIENFLKLKVGSAVNLIAWSPLTKCTRSANSETEDVLEDGSIQLCFSASDNVLYSLLVSVNSANDVNVQKEVIGKHDSFINDISIRRCTENSQVLLGSVSEDCTCCIWDLLSADKLVHQISLKSVATSVKWHAMDPLQVMVAERGGIIRFYRIDNGSPLRCLQGLPSLMSADWSPSNPLIVGAVAGTKCLLWDTSVSSLPIDTRSVHGNPAVKFNWSTTNDNIFSTIGVGYELKVHHRGHRKNPLAQKLSTARSVDWHTETGLHLVAVACDRSVHMWNIKE